MRRTWIPFPHATLSFYKGNNKFDDSSTAELLRKYLASLLYLRRSYVDLHFHLNEPKHPHCYDDYLDLKRWTSLMFLGKHPVIVYDWHCSRPRRGAQHWESWKASGVSALDLVVGVRDVFVSVEAAHPSWSRKFQCCGPEGKRRFIREFLRIAINPTIIKKCQRKLREGCNPSSKLGTTFGQSLSSRAQLSIPSCWEEVLETLKTRV